MAETIAIKPEIIRWAVKRSQLAMDDLVQAFPKLGDWETGDGEPTLRQLEKLAKKTMTPLGYFFLDTPPVEKLPIPDFRTIGDRKIGPPSPNLMETVQTMERRQGWMREYVIEEGQDPLSFVGSVKITASALPVAARIRNTLGLSPDWAESHSSWEQALNTLRGRAEQVGILVARTGVVGLNNKRLLDPQEFQGFVLCDDYAPLIFVNAADFKAAQMFTLAHELVHIWVGRGGLFHMPRTMPHDDETEKFCNRVAAELLVPSHTLLDRWPGVKHSDEPFQDLARAFKVSAVVAARRALDLKLITKKAFFAFYDEDHQQWKNRRARQKAEKKGGGDFYRNQDAKLGKRFAYAIVRAAREGRLLYREAYRLTGLKGATFSRYADRVLARMRNELQ